MSKIIFMDVDGTLTNYENKIPQSAKDAIRKARYNGHKIYLCTGRSRAEIYDEIWEIGFDGLIGANGAYIEDGNQVLCHKHLSKQEVKSIVDWLHHKNLEFYLECNSGLYASERFIEVGKDVAVKYAAYKRHHSSYITMYDLFPEIIEGADLYRDDVNKISFILNSYEDHLESIKQFPRLKAETWGGVGGKALFGDLALKYIDKLLGIKLLLEHLGVKHEDSIAIGDASIDIPMIKFCKVGICVGSGSDDTKAVADYVSRAVDDDGVYDAFQYCDLI